MVYSRLQQFTADYMQFSRWGLGLAPSKVFCFIRKTNKKGQSSPKLKFLNLLTIVVQHFRQYAYTYTNIFRLHNALAKNKLVDLFIEALEQLSQPNAIFKVTVY